ncbi:nitroreductase family protein [Aureibacillus halotolerans]|uniref:Nitroreductase n=1 Tax=Aureibacillus halotolerans TaxID=1508390 RepID=A0A4R6UD87_9BACI|nr:nitroreductase [Aureibacillus halotolerans]TDQ42745.1 nitroreductase [Aureibacillus halotolerans]
MYNVDNYSHLKYNKYGVIKLPFEAKNTTAGPVAEAIRSRRSIKTNYSKEPVPGELVRDILEDAVYAPNHGLREPWRFLFISSERKDAFVEELVTLFPRDRQDNRRDYFSQPSAFLVVVMKEDPRQKENEENYSACAALIQNFQLLAWERKLGVCWKTQPHVWDPKALRILGVQPGEKIVGFLHLGFFDDENVPAPKERSPLEEKLSFF